MSDVAQGQWIVGPDNQWTWQQPDGSLWQQAPDGSWKAQQFGIPVQPANPWGAGIVGSAGSNQGPLPSAIRQGQGAARRPKGWGRWPVAIVAAVIVLGAGAVAYAVIGSGSGNAGPVDAVECTTSASSFSGCFDVPGPEFQGTSHVTSVLALVQNGDHVTGTQTYLASATGHSDTYALSGTVTGTTLSFSTVTMKGSSVNIAQNLHFAVVREGNSLIWSALGTPGRVLTPISQAQYSSAIASN